METIRWLEDVIEPEDDFNQTASDIAVEEVHNSDAYTSLLLNVTLIGCLLLAYYVKSNRIYSLPERYVEMCELFLWHLDTANCFFCVAVREP